MPTEPRPKHSVKITTKFAYTGPGALKKLRECDLQRAQRFSAGPDVHDSNAFVVSRNTDPRNDSALPSHSVKVFNAGMKYIAILAIGASGTTYEVLVDSGSSLTFIGLGKKYVVTDTSQKTGQAILGRYGVGTFVGMEYIDKVKLAEDLVIKRQGIEVALESWDLGNLDGYDGIMGIGPIDLTTHTNIKYPKEEIQTVLDNLFIENVINTKSIGIFFLPTESVGESFLIFGGAETGGDIGEINYVSITGQPSSSPYWGIDQKSITYGDGMQIMGQASGIVDSGTTLLNLSPDAFQAYQKATCAKLDPASGYLALTADQYKNLKSLWFNIGGVKYEFTANAQIWPRKLTAGFKDGADLVFLVVGSTAAESRFDFVLGYVFLQRFYAELDATNNQVGLATTKYTYDNSN